MPAKAEYVVVAIRNWGDQFQTEKVFKGAPQDGQIANWLVQRRWLIQHSNMPLLAVRYFPKSKGWRIIDLTKAFVAPNIGAARHWWSGIRKSGKVFPSEDAAVMVAVHALNPPVQENLDL